MFPLADPAAWLERFRECRQAALRVATELASEGGGPLTSVARRANDPDVWRGVIADQFIGVIGGLDRALDPQVAHLEWLVKELDAAERDADGAVRAGAVGLPVPTSFDPVAIVNRLRAFSPPDTPSFFGWQAPLARASGFVGLRFEAARAVAAELHRSADQLRRLPEILRGAFDSLGLEVPAALDVIAREADTVADEIVRRVQAFEEADSTATAGFRSLLGLGLGSGVPGGFGRASPVLSDGRQALPALPDGATGPGQQPAQVKEADPVSTSTGNYFYQSVDLAQPARGVPTTFVRTYNSLRADVDGSLGRGWSHSLEIHLIIDESGVTVEWGDGSRDRYRRSGFGFVAPPGVHDVVHQVSGGYQLAVKAKLRYHFDQGGRLVAITDASGNRSVLHRDSGGELTAVLDASGLETLFERDNRGRVTAVVGVLQRRWSYDYNRHDLLAGVTDPEGGKTNYEYDADHRLSAIIDPEGRLVVRNRYDEAGRVVQQTDGAGAAWRYIYEPDMTVVTDPLGHERAFRFDERFRTTAIADALNVVTTFAWDDDSNLSSVVDPTGRRFEFSWDRRGNLVSATGPQTAPVTFVWDEDDNLAAVVSANGDRATTTWDEHARPVEICTPAGIRTTARWRADGLPETVTDGSGAAISYRYDDAGRPETVTDGLGHTTQVSFDPAGRPVWERHPDGAEMAFKWDRADRLVAVTDAAGGTVRFGYDRSGRLLATTDALGRTTRYGYDQRGFTATVTDPLGRQTSFGYDLCGRLTTRRDARGAAVSFSHDPAGRLVHIDAADITPIAYHWDAAGRLVGMSDETGHTTWDLDAAGRPAVEHRPDGTDVVHSYDALGRRRRVELRRDGGVVVAWDEEVDADSRITGVGTSAGMTRLAYDVVGRLQRITYRNGVTTSWSYDAVGQPVGLETIGVDGATLDTWRASYDADGNRVGCERMDDADGGSTTTVYSYDEVGRLTSSTTESTSANFAWDPAHNRISASVAGPASFDAADQIVTDGHCRYEHDAAGHLVGRQPLDGNGKSLSCSYDALGRLVALDGDGDGEGEEVRFAYDGLGRRTSRTISVGAQHRIFDGVDVLAEFDNDGQLTVETRAGLLVLARSNRVGTRFLHPGMNAEVAAVTDDSGRLLARYHYGPFGEQRVAEGEEGAAGTLGYCGTLGIREESGGLLDMRARLYDPALGRFLSPDPWPATLPEPVTLNRYLYALGDPISHVDPYGLFCWTGKNDKGKCRGVRDVTQRVGHAVRTPLEITSAVSSGVAAIAMGVTVVCPVPCGVISAPVAAAAGAVGTATGIAATAAHCAAEWSFTDFKCAAGIASGALGSVVGFGVDASRVLLGWTDETYRLARFGSAIFGTFVQGSTAAADLRRK